MPPGLLMPPQALGKQALLGQQLKKPIYVGCQVQRNLIIHTLVTLRKECT